MEKLILAYVNTPIISRKMITFLLNIHFPVQLYLIIIAVCNNSVQSQPILHPIELGITNIAKLNNYLVNVELLTEKQYNFVFFLSYPIIKEIKSYGLKSKISKSFKENYQKTVKSTNMNFQKTAQTRYCIGFNEELTNAFHNYIFFEDVKFVEEIIKLQFDVVIDKIKKINKHISLLLNIFSTLENYNKNND